MYSAQQYFCESIPNGAPSFVVMYLGRCPSPSLVEKESDLSLDYSQQVEIETDEEVIMRRQKQIDYGKCSESYEKYVAKIPR